METFYLSPDQFWDWFDRTQDRIGEPQTDQRTIPAKRMRTTEQKDKPKHIDETQAARGIDRRYIIMWGRPKPGKKNKTWEGDGYLSMVGQLAHLSDLRGKMLEEPTLLDHIDFKTVQDLGELNIGGLEVQVVDVDE